MGCELPLVSAVMARLPQATVSLAAYGGVVFPLALLLESPVIMLLSASTALCKDWQSYRLVRRYMFLAGGATTVFHALLAFTPLYDLVIGGLLHPPAEVLGPARTGLQIMLPWTLSIAYRRTQQGVLIRAGRSRAVGMGTLVRLGANVLTLAVGIWIGHIPGIVIGTMAVAAGVASEALFAGIAVRPVLHEQLRHAPPAATPLTAAAFARFFAPLVVTPVILFLSGPITSGGMSRMPRALESLAVWPVVNGLVFALRSVGFALNEVVVAMLDRPGAARALGRFGLGLAAVGVAALLLVAGTPLSHLWFSKVSALPPELAALGGVAVWFAVLMPAISALQSCYQGSLLHAHRTRGITEAVLVYLGISTGILVAGVATQKFIGIHVAILAMTVGSGGQLLWLRLRARANHFAFHVPALAPKDSQRGTN